MYPFLLFHIEIMTTHHFQMYTYRQDSYKESGNDYNYAEITAGNTIIKSSTNGYDYITNNTGYLQIDVTALDENDLVETAFDYEITKYWKLK